MGSFSANGVFLPFRGKSLCIVRLLADFRHPVRFSRRRRDKPPWSPQPRNPSPFPHRTRKKSEPNTKKKKPNANHNRRTKQKKNNPRVTTLAHQPLHEIENKSTGWISLGAYVSTQKISSSIRSAVSCTNNSGDLSASPRVLN